MSGEGFSVFGECEAGRLAPASAYTAYRRSGKSNLAPLRPFVPCVLRHDSLIRQAFEISATGVLILDFGRRETRICSIQLRLQIQS